MSLALRLFVMAAVWSLAALAIAYLVLITFYRADRERSFEAILNLHLFNVVAAIQQDEVGQIYGNPQLGDPRFESFLSGWYWQAIRLGDRDQVITSPSLANGRLNLFNVEETPFDANFQRVMDIDGPNGERLRAMEQLVLFDRSGDRLAFAVAADLDVVEADVARFRNRLLAVFALLGIGLVAISVVQVAIGLRPLRAVGRALTAIREGRTERIPGSYPREIAPLTEEVNALIEANAKTVERARTHVGNLAHALKTPLSVITNEARAAKGPLGEKVVEQAGLMRHQIDYYLDRARVAATGGVVTTVTEVEPLAATFGRAMAKIYADRGVSMDVDIEPGLRFQGEKQDLEELFGNLVDNAFKWARSQVRLSGRRIADAPKEGARDGGAGGRAMIEIVVEDDGPGLTADQRSEATRRGRRLDESQPGSGLGLSIVRDLADLYNGSFELSASPLGGLRAQLRLPSA
ncbi:ATP-binding protein [Microbaculum marinum]|uniref:histidine kinase n=1 Tax=Microbaculum marinum TaxID=1764581 RepID=A0AAW9RW56_9HYPH